MVSFAPGAHEYNGRSGNSRATRQNNKLSKGAPLITLTRLEELLAGARREAPPPSKPLRKPKKPPKLPHRDWPRDYLVKKGDHSMDNKTTAMHAATIRTLPDGKGEVVISDGSVDRMNDCISPAGWRLESFNRTGGPVLVSHDHSSLPVARSQARVQGTRLVAVYEWPPQGVSTRADEVRRLVESGFLRTTSVGFKPLKWVFNEERRGVDFQEQELLEWSWVGIPANANALSVASVGERERILKWLGATGTVRSPILATAGLIPVGKGQSVCVPYDAASPRGADGRAQGPALRVASGIPAEQRVACLSGLLPGPEIDLGDLTSYGLEAVVRDVVKQRLAQLKADLRQGRR